MALGRHQGLALGQLPHPTPPLPKRNEWTLLGKDRPSLTCNQTLPGIDFCPQSGCREYRWFQPGSSTLGQLLQLARGQAMP